MKRLLSCCLLLLSCGDPPADAPAVAPDAVVSTPDPGTPEPDPGLSEPDPGADEPDDGPVVVPDIAPDAGPGEPMDAGLDRVEPMDVEEVQDADDPDAGPPPVLFDPFAVPVDEAAFDHGVRSGDPTAEGIVLVSRYVGPGVMLRALVFADGAEEGALPVAAEAEADPNDDGYARVEVAGLTPGEAWRYTFVAVDGSGAPLSRSPFGTFLTAPHADAMEPVVFGGTSCSKQTYKPFQPLAHAAVDGLSFFLLAGDTTYADGAGDLQTYRKRWDEALLDEGYVALMQDTPVVATWDDHEVENNWNPEAIDEGKRAAATTAFFEQLPVSTPNGEQTIWRSLRWGKAVEVFVLDCRSERKPSTIFSADPIYVSKAQMAWLKESLKASDAVFKIILNSVPITEMPPLFLTSWDRWQGYGAQRDEIIDFINAEVDNVVWLSGDFHFPAVTHVGPPGTPEHAQREVLMGPTAHIPNPLWLSVAADPNLTPQFPFSGGDLSYTRFTADPTTDPPHLLVEVVGATGDVVYTETIEAE